MAERRCPFPSPLPLLSRHTLFKKNLLLGRELGVKEGSGREKAFGGISAAVFAASGM